MYQNIGSFLCNLITRKIHHFFFSFTLVLMLIASPAYSAGYSCPTYKEYTSCNAGYYLNGNACVDCSSASNSSSQSCTRSCSISNGTCSYSGSTQQCQGNYTTGTAGSNGVSQCSGCSSWGACSGGTMSITCNANYYKSGSSCAACSDVPYTDSGSDTETITGGTRTRSKSRTCYRSTSLAGSTSSSACSGTSSCGDYTYGSWSYSCSAGYYLSGSSCAQCEAGYSCPGDNSRYTCSGTTYSSAGASSCTSCPNSATGYYSWDGDTLHDSVYECYKNVSYTASYGSGTQNCYYTSGSGTSAVYAGNSSAGCDTKKITSCNAGYYLAASSDTDCSVAGIGYYSASGSTLRSACTSYRANTTTTTTTASSSDSCVCVAGRYLSSSTCATCAAGTYKSSAGNGACSSVSAGCYGSEGATSACPAYCAKGTYSTGGASACTKCPGGTYGSTTGLTSAACSGSCTAGYYCPAGSTSATQNACTTNATSGAGSDAISDCVCKAGYSGNAATSGGTCTACACGTYKSGTGNTTCTTTDAGYYATGTGNTGQAKATVGNYAAAGACSQTACPSGYPNSSAGAVAITSCYSDTKSRAWSGAQTACSKPTNCATVTCNSCSDAACDYVAYSNSAGDGDGAIKSGCSTNSVACQQTVKSVTANTNSYVDGTACKTCDASYPYSDGGNISSSDCYTTKTNTGSQLECSKPDNSASYTCGTCTPGTCDWRDYNGAADTTCTPANCTKPVSTVSCNTGYYKSDVTCPPCTNKPSNSSYTGTATSNSCPWTCNSGYNQTADNQCGQFCTSGITHIKLSNGLSVPLYSTARTSPAINVKWNNSICYGSLSSGNATGALNVKVGTTTYHSTN